MFVLDNMAPSRTSWCMDGLQDTLLNTTNLAFEGTEKRSSLFLLPSFLTQTVKELPVCAHSRSEDSHYRAGVFPSYTGPGVSHRDTKTWLNKSALLRHSPPSLALLRFLYICFLDTPWLLCPPKHEFYIVCLDLTFWRLLWKWNTLNKLSFRLS